ncbi:MAG: ABC transporter permease [Chloroflexota bacterium]|nr:ABC transporter permease [Chloroflexota bacterium]
MRNLRAIYIIWYRDLLRFWRDRARLVASFAQPFLFLVIIGTGLSAGMMLLGGESGYSYIQFMFPGIIGMVVFFTAIMGGVSIVWDREFGFLKEVLVAPISRTAVAIGKALGGATIACVQGAVMLVFVPFVGVSISVAQVFLLIPLMFVFAFSMTSLGILIASRIKTMESFQVVMQLLLFPLFFLSPALFPTDRLPSWLGVPVRLNPVSYGVDSLRQSVLAPSEGMPALGITVFGHTMSIAEDVAVLVVFGAVMASLAVWSFRNQE